MPLKILPQKCMSVAKEGKVFEPKKLLQPLLDTSEGTKITWISLFLLLTLNIWKEKPCLLFDHKHFPPFWCNFWLSDKLSTSIGPFRKLSVIWRNCRYRYRCQKKQGHYQKKIDLKMTYCWPLLANVEKKAALEIGSAMVNVKHYWRGITFFICRLKTPTASTMLQKSSSWLWGCSSIVIVFFIVIVFLLVWSYPLVTLITGLKDHKSLGLLFEGVL